LAIEAQRCPALDATIATTLPLPDASPIGNSQGLLSAISKMPPGEEVDNLFEMSGICRNDEWDAGDTLMPSNALSSRSRVPEGLSCTRGPKGVLSISLEGKLQASLQSELQETLSSPDALKGSAGVSWVRGEVLGHGTLGMVYKALDQRSGQIFAVKEVRIDKQLDSDLKFQAALENEISIYKELSHPHIVSYLGHDLIDSSLCIYLEYMAGGSVAQVLSQFGPLDESLVATYAKELLEGLEYLHSRSPVVLHRDVKGANILVGLDCRVKLSDFGCSKRTADTMSQSLRGSIPWMAPEIIQQTGYGRRSDVWSLGCVLIEMATAKHPWGSFDNPMAAMMRIGMSNETPPVPDHVSDTCNDFISLCTKRDRTVRPHAAELLKHEFVCDILNTSM